MYSRKQGFTIIELLVVIAIIGILAATVLASLGESRSRARDVRRIQDIQQIQKALDLYLDDHGSEYPDDIYSSTDGLANAANGKAYISTVPRDPRGTNYLYANLTRTSSACAKATGFCTSYVLGATLEGIVPPDVDGASVGSGADSVNCADTGGPGGTPNNYCVRP